MISTPEHLQHLNDLDLRNRIDHQECVLYDLVDHAQDIARSEDCGPKTFDGIYFAFKQYRELVKEMDRRFKQSKHKEPGAVK